MTMVSWRDIPLTCPAESLECKGADRPDLMRRLRDDGGIPDWFTATADELAACDDDEAADLGPKADAIDWSGLDETGPFRVRVGDNDLRARYGTLADAAEGAARSGFGDGDTRVAVWGGGGERAFDGTLDGLLERAGLGA